MKTNKKNTASQALLDLEEMKRLLKEESKNTVKALLAEAVKDGLNDAIQDDEDDDENEEYEITDSADDSDVDEDSADEDAPETFSDEDDEDVAEEGDEDIADESAEDEDADEESDDENEWSAFDKYKNEDGDYDFSGEDDEAAKEDLIKVYKLLKDSDQVIVKKEGNRAEIKDAETGAEYVIDFGDDTTDGEVEVEKVEDEDEDSMELNESENKNKKARKTMKESKNQVLFEVDLGYTDNYQDKDPIDGLSAAEPAKNKKDWDAGVPKDTKKPWAGKGENDPFTEKVNEEEEMEDPMDVDADADIESDEITLEEGGIGHKGKVVARSSAKKQMKDKGAKVTRHNSKGGKYKSREDESIEKKVNKLMAENKALKSAALELKRNLQEALLVNVNLGKVTKLFTENTTTRQEKLDIIGRFDAVKSFAESSALYESISRELASTKKQNVTLEEKQFTAAGTRNLNESKVYENPALGEIRNMMSRMDKAY